MTKIQKMHVEAIIVAANENIKSTRIKATETQGGFVRIGFKTFSDKTGKFESYSGCFFIGKKGAIWNYRNGKGVYKYKNIVVKENIKNLFDLVCSGDSFILLKN